PRRASAPVPLVDRLSRPLYSYYDSRRGNVAVQVTLGVGRWYAVAMQVTIDFSDPAVQANPYPILEDLRENRPGFWNGNAWLVTRHEDIVSLFTDPRMSSQRIDATFAVLPEDVQKELQPLREVLGDRMLLSDPPKHTRLRTLVMKAFSAKAAAGRRDRIQML